MLALNCIFMAMAMDLNDIWSIYFHDPNDKDWTMKSYHHMSMLSTVDDFWVVQKAMQDKVADGMFFIMREYIFPCWDDPENKEGGCFSIKVNRSVGSGHLTWT